MGIRRDCECESGDSPQRIRSWDNDSIAKAADLAVSIAKENSRLYKGEPVQLAPQKVDMAKLHGKHRSEGEKMRLKVPIKRKDDLLLTVNRCCRMKARPDFINNKSFHMVNEQKILCISTEGSLQSTRISMANLSPFTVTKELTLRQ
jgi:TldD protein